jgi:hypothetical protein
MHVCCLVCVGCRLKQGCLFLCIMCSLCLIPINLLLCPTYELLQVFHFSLYIPLEFILFWIILSLSCLYMVLVAWKAMFSLVCLNRLVTLCISGLWWVNVIHFFFRCVSVVHVCCFLVISFFFRLWIICNGNPLFLAIVRMVFHSYCLVCSVIGSIIILFI